MIAIREIAEERLGTAWFSTSHGVATTTPQATQTMPIAMTRAGSCRALARAFRSFAEAVAVARLAQNPPPSQAIKPAPAKGKPIQAPQSTTERPCTKVGAE